MRLPENDIDKILFWDTNTTYFEFHYKILIKSIQEYLRLAYFNKGQGIHLSYNEFEKTSIDGRHYFLTMRLFDVGRTNAFMRNNDRIHWLTSWGFPPLKVESDFVVYDSNIDLDDERSRVMPGSREGYSTTKDVLRPKHLIDCQNRKVRRSSDC